MVRKLIQDGDLVLRRKPNVADAGKLQPKWEGPYTAKAAERPRSFYLIDGGGKQPLIPGTLIVCVGSTSKM